MQAVILAGGLGTRLSTLTGDRPKSLVPVLGRPFLDYQLALLDSHGVTDVVLCVGHLAAQIREHVGNGSRFGVRVRLSDEGERRLGTGGALRWAEALLDDAFLVLFGDSYLVLDYRAVMASLLASDRLGLMVVRRNDDGYESSDVVVDDGFVAAYGRDRSGPRMVYINYGLSALRRRALLSLARGAACSLQELYRPLIEARQLLAYEVHDHYYEIGSPRGLADLEQWLATQRDIEERPGSPGALPSVGGVGAMSGPPLPSEERPGCPGALPSVGGVGAMSGPPLPSAP
ncbi:MAG: NTP transferase domain-containing protein [Candidatus Rokubacteria bacterium]|nr:NTP transferase domain-containing protein [Candidatus Rokubacteria bacterium]